MNKQLSTKQAYRLDKFSGGDVKGGRRLNFRFDGKDYQGLVGDSLASALLANGVRLVGRSFKYHRRRGFLAAGTEEPNALVQLGEGALTEPNCQATRIELYEGLKATSQNAFPSVKFDLMALNSVFGKILPSGFYYKTFMQPASFWMFYERIIRHIAGLGKAPRQRDPEHYDRRHAHCDVLVAGGGAAGLTAAYLAGASGADVILADEDCRLGGSLLYSAALLDGKAAGLWVEEMRARLEAMPNVRILPRTTIVGYYDYNFLTAVERVSDHITPDNRRDKIRRRFWKIRAEQVILAQGAIERPLVFGNNDNPGVMLASAVQSYLQRYGVLCGRKAVVFTNNDSAYDCALALRRAGAEVVLVDARSKPPKSLTESLEAADVELRSGSVVTRAISGGDGVRSVQLASAEDGRGAKERLSCDLLAMSGGWTPTVHLYSQAGGQLSYNNKLGILTPSSVAAKQPKNNSCRCIGASNGQFGLAEVFDDAVKQTTQILTELGLKPRKVKLPKVSGDWQLQGIGLLWRVPGSQGKAFVDFQNDVTHDDILLAHREGYESVEHLKRYTTTGMGTDQGKTSNMNALAVMAECRGLPVEAVGNTTFRPPYSGITFGAIAGRNRGDLFIQQRTTPMHASHVAASAVFEDVGDWKRPRYFPEGKETMAEAVQRESLAARRTVGMLDASTLGKIDIQGKDSVRLLNMLYPNKWDKLAVGRCRYGVMLNEDGMIFDDGVTSRLGEHHFHMTTTTGGAARVMSWLEEWLQTEWPTWKVYCTSVTEQWAVATVSGPMARRMLQPLCDIDLSGEAFPFMSVREARIGGIAARIFRISFTGDLAYEINVPAGYGGQLWEMLREAGKAHDLCLYGTETMHLLRAEKGFLIVGQDTDGTITPADAGLHKMVAGDKDFLGKRSLSRSDTSRGGRKQLVGVLAENRKFVIPEGAHIVAEQVGAPPMEMLGHVTSSYYSPNCDRSIAMALIKDGFARDGERYFVPLMDGSWHAVTISASPIFFDRDGGRQNG